MLSCMNYYQPNNQTNMTLFPVSSPQVEVGLYWLIQSQWCSPDFCDNVQNVSALEQFMGAPETLIANHLTWLLTELYHVYVSVVPAESVLSNPGKASSFLSYPLQQNQPIEDHV